MEYPFKDLLPLDEVLEREGYYKDWTHLDPEVFYSLTQISEYIKTKGYGVDVRLLIAQLAEHFGLKTTQVVDLGNLLQAEHATLKQQVQQAVAQVNADRNALETQFNQSVAQMEADKNAVIANATVDSEVILARGGKATLGQRLDETTAQLAQTGLLMRKDAYSDFKQKGATLNIIVGLDSLTAGTGTGANNTKWLDYFKEHLYSVYGYGGAGYVPFSNETSINDDDILSLGTTGLSSVEALTDLADYRVQNSFDNKGVYAESASNATMDVNIKNKWMNGKIFYLIQPGGGSFTVGYISGSLTSIDTNGAEYSIGVFTLPKNISQNGQVAFRSITGNVVIYGGVFTNDSGVTISRIGKGGDKLATHASKNATTFQTFLTHIEPDTLILNAGSNDSLTSTEFKNIYSSYIEPYRNIGCEIISIIPHAMAGSPIWKFAGALREVAELKKLNVIDLTDVLGATYEEARAKNNISTDGIHQTDSGNRLYAHKMLSYFNIPAISKKVDKSFETTKDFFVELSNKELSTHGITARTAIAYDLGLLKMTNGEITSGFVTVEVLSAIKSMSEISCQRYVFPISNNTPVDNTAVTDIGMLSKTDIVANETLGVNLTTSVVGGRVIVTVSINGSVADYVRHRIKAKYTGISQYRQGSAIFEN